MSDVVERIRELIERERSRFRVPGCAVLVVSDGEVVLAEGFGLRHTDKQLPVTAQTLFPIGSSTKTFTAAVCASLVDDGELDLDQPIRELLPGFGLQDPIATQLLSVRDCLSHRSGLPRHDLLWYAGEGRLTREDLIAALPHLPTTKPFRQTWQYNNMLYTTAGYLAGRLSGGTYEDAVRRRLLDPLGMARTNFRVAEVEKDADHSRPYVLQEDDAVAEVPYAHLDLVGPAGCINSCAEELGPWVLTLLGRGVGANPPLLSDAVLEEMRTPAMPLPQGALPGAGTPVGYGLGVAIEDYRGHRIVHHGGNIDGFSSQVAVIPAAGVGVAVLTNLGSNPLRDALPYVVFDELLGLAPEPHGETIFAKWDALRQGMSQGKARRAETAKPFPPVRPLENYAGCYRHPGYGDVQVAVHDGSLTASYGSLTGTLEHRHLEVFDYTLTAGGDELRFAVQFTHDLEAEVDALQLPLEALLPPLRFARQPDAEHLTDELLDRLAGIYALGALEVVVSRRGDKGLLITAPMSPPRPLRLVRETVFTVDGAQLEFTDDGRVLTPFGEFTKRA